MYIIQISSLIILIGLHATSTDAVASTSPGCATSELDLVFVLDTSTDVTQEDLENSKSFIRRLILPFDVNPVATRVSVVTYGNTAHIVSDLADISVALTDYDEPFGAWEVLRLLNNSVPVGGKRRTGQALRLACDEVLKFKSVETRRNVPAVIVIISGGYSEDDIPSDLSCKEYETADVTIVGVSTDRRGAVIFGSQHIDKAFEINYANAETTERLIFATICDERVWHMSLAEQDLVFLLHRADVIPAEGLQSIKSYIWEISRQFALAHNLTRIGILEFGGSVLSRVTYLTADLAHLLEAIDGITYNPIANGAGNLTEILRHVALSTFRDEGDDARQNLHRNLIIITTSPVRITPEAQTAARDLMLGGVNIFVVTVGMPEAASALHVISSKPFTSHIVPTKNYQDLLTSKKRMVRSLRDHAFKRYSGSLLELHFIVGGLSSKTEQIRAADLMKRITDLFFIGQDYTRVYITTGSESLRYAGDVKSGVFKEISNKDYADEVDIVNRVQDIFNRGGSRNKVIVIITPEVIQNPEIWGRLATMNKGKGYIYSLGYDSGGLEWKFDASGFRKWQQLQMDYRPAADILVDKISDDTNKDCDVVELDLQFLVDGSSSIQENDFSLAKDWIQSLISKFNVGQYTTRVGIDQYSGDPETEFHLVDLNGKATVLQAVDTIDQKTGLTKTGYAINYTLANSLVPSAGSRHGVRQIFVVLTDGKSRDDVSSAARKAHERPRLTSYAVGVADADIAELNEIASEPKAKHVFQAENFNEISGLQDVIGSSICKTATENATVPSFNGVNIIILLEDSAALMSNQLYPSLVKFIMKLAKTAADNYSSRIAVVKFATEPSVIQQFTRNLTLLRQELLANKMETSDPQSQVNLGLALSFVKGMFGESNSRKHVKNILVTIVSNPITDNAIEEVNGLTERGVHIFGISIGRASSLTHLQQLTTNADYFFTIARTHHLIQVEPSIKRYIHELPCPPPFVCEQKMNVAFLIDESAVSTTEGFQEILKFIADISNRLTLNDDSSSASIIQLESDRTSYKVESYSGDNAPNDILQANMHDTLIDAANAIGIIGEITFQNDQRRNYPKNVVVITGAPAAPAMDSNIVAESGAKLLTISIGSIDVDKTDTNSDILRLSSYDELASVSMDVVKAICDAATCPTWIRGTKEMKGYDMISSLGLPTSSAVKVIDGMPPIYRVYGKSRVRGQIEQIFPNGFPSQRVKFTASLKMGKRAFNTDSWNIFELTDSRGRTEFSINVDGKMKTIRLFRKGSPDTTVSFSGSRVESFFNKKWHVMEVVLTDSAGVLIIDCQRIGSKRFEASLESLPENGEVRIGKLTNGRKSTAFQFERLDMMCGIEADFSTSLETCSEVKDHGLTKPNTTSKPVEESRGSESFKVPDSTVKLPRQECNCTQGPSGPPGQKGESGVPGINGIDGRSGLVGPKGDKGSSGSSVTTQSEIGPAGPPGPPGPRGPPGLPGLVSSGNTIASIRNQKAFTMGASDARITQIAQDECRIMINSEVSRIVMSILEREFSSERFRGRKGDKGSQGETGRTGDRGYAGETGHPGRTGRPGIRGIAGPEGPKGPKGGTGERGETGYGIPGSKGMKGPRGYPGQSITGDPGRKGERGDSGISGPPGLRGLRGPAGINGRCEHHACYNAALRFVSESMRGRDND